MSLRFRVFAVVGVLVLALCGCQKGNTNASSGTPDMSESAKADSKGANSSAKSGRNSAKSGSKQAAHTNAKHEKTEAAKHEKTEAAKHKKTEAAKKTSPGPAVMKSGTLTEADNEMEFNFRQGQLITVVLDSNRASGLSWNLVEPSGSVIVRDGSPSYAVAKGKSGAGTETWHFRATKPGQQLVRMEYRRKWASSSPERSFRFTGTVR
ncbi:MAG TPA: protease inhibitor I42 family protein [Candidatus Binatia bacterium]|nr:protease inhibitor I42 family protein [Candidatus Binatia bacterium]